MISFIDGFLIGVSLTILIYKIYWETRLSKIEKQNTEMIRGIIDKLLANENDLPIERECENE